MPASTIQILGAEKALFRSLKTGSNPPKHGIIFQHATSTCSAKMADEVKLQEQCSCKGSNCLLE